MAETCGYRQQDPISTAAKQQDSATDITSLTQEVAKLTKTVSELAVSKPKENSFNQPSNSNSFDQPSNSASGNSYYRQSNSFQRVSPQFNNQVTCYNCNFPGHIKRECNWNGQSQPTPGKCQLCRQQGHPAFRCRTQTGQRQGNARNPGENRPNRQGFRN